ncbi:Uncharacterized protein Rs2_40926 [Raphanus sativus]|nr:Uncharacterized protein Rs2_40926 [Raphanus sativus]
MFWSPASRTDVPFLLAGRLNSLMLVGRPSSRSGRRASRTDVPLLVGRPDCAQPYILIAGRAEQSFRFCSPEDQTRVLHAGCPDLRSGRRASRTDVPFLLAGRPDSRSARRTTRLAFCSPGAQTYVLVAGRVERTSRFCSPGDQTRVLVVGRPDLRSGGRASRTDVPFLLAG